MSIYSNIMDELWAIKDELASGFKTFQEFANDMLKYQAEHHPEFSSAQTGG